MTKITVKQIKKEVELLKNNKAIAMIPGTRYSEYVRMAITCLKDEDRLEDLRFDDIGAVSKMLRGDFDND